jgi:hypothetical protein
MTDDPTWGSRLVFRRVRLAVSSVAVLASLLLTACGPAPASGPPKPAAVPAGTITVADVNAYAEALATLQTESGGDYDSARLVSLMDSRAITNDYFKAALEASANTTRFPSIAKDMKRAEADWRVWSQGKTDIQIADQMSMSVETTLSDSAVQVLWEAHSLVFALDALVPDPEDDTVFTVELLGENRVRLVPNPVGDSELPYTYAFAKGEDGTWRVVGIDSVNIEQYLEGWYAIGD